jgi:hypothetical protein
MTTAQTTAKNVLREFGASASTIIDDVEVIDHSSAAAVPARTDTDGVTLKPFGFRVTVAGNVKMTTLAGTVVKLAFEKGDFPIAVSQIWKTADGTTATVACFFYGVRKSKPGAIA